MADWHNKTTFSDYSLHPALLSALSEAKFTELTELQKQILPFTLNVKDVHIVSPSGSGKTAAYSLSILHYLMSTPVAPDAKGPWALIIVANDKVMNTAKRSLSMLGKYTGLKSLLAYPRANLEKQCQLFQEQEYDIVLATAVRLKELIATQALSLANIDTLAIDGFNNFIKYNKEEDIDAIFSALPPTKQRFNILLSNEITEPAEIACNKYFPNIETLIIKNTEVPKTVEISDSAAIDKPIDEPTSVPNIKPEKVLEKKPEITEALYHPNDFEKTPLLLGLLQKLQPQRALIFVENKENLNRLNAIFQSNGHHIFTISSSVDNRNKEALLKKISHQNPKIILTTEKAARNINFENIDCIINYDLPSSAQDYVQHSSRFTNSGHHISFVEENFISKLPEIERAIDHKLPLELVDESLLADIIPPELVNTIEEDRDDINGNAFAPKMLDKPKKNTKSKRFSNQRHSDNRHRQEEANI